MQKGWAVVMDVTAERGEVAIEQCFSTSTDTTDGNPAIASVLQGMEEQGGCLAGSWVHGEHLSVGVREREGLGALERGVHPPCTQASSGIDVFLLWPLMGSLPSLLAGSCGGGEVMVIF